MGRGSNMYASPFQIGEEPTSQGSSLYGICSTTRFVKQYEGWREQFS
jgi:hypothetical protein